MSKLENVIQMMSDSQAHSGSDQRNLLLELGATMQQLFAQQAQQQHRALEDASTSALSINSLAHTLGPMDRPPMILGRDDISHLEDLHSDKDASDIVLKTKDSRDDTIKILEATSARFSEESKSVLALMARIQNIRIDSGVRNRLEDWNKHPDSTSLWIQGPYDVPKPSQNTLFAVCLVALSQNSGIPCVFYSCSLEAMSHREVSREELLMAMVKSLIFQMVLLLPHDFIADVDFSMEQFHRLAHDAMNAFESVDLLIELRRRTSPYIHIVIDGIEVLEDRSDMEQTRNLKTFLFGLLSTKKVPSAMDVSNGQASAEWRESDRSAPILPQVTKIALTTDGYVDILAQLVEEACLDKVEFLTEADEAGANDAVDFIP
ncbi:MAG: hypothetical protein Q9220_007625 [cf. Caloplaca sp. 1 TL-2023]